jgi:hypothetical protein
MVVPRVWLSAWHEHPYRPAFFAQGIYRTCLRPGDNVLALPFRTSYAMLWQAESGFAFHMANGDIAPGAPEGVPEPRLLRRLDHRKPPTDPKPLLAWARKQGVTTIVAAGPDAGAWVRFLSPVERPRRLGGVYFFDLRANGGRCSA